MKKEGKRKRKGKEKKREKGNKGLIPRCGGCGLIDRASTMASSLRQAQSAGHDVDCQSTRCRPSSCRIVVSCLVTFFK